MTPDHPKLMRLITIMRLMNSKRKGMTINDIAKSANVDPRTIYRYFNSFKELGLKVEKTVSTEGMLYKLRKTSNELSEILEFTPFAESTCQKQFISEYLYCHKKTGYVVENIETSEMAIFVTIQAIVLAFPKINEHTLYIKLSGSASNQVTIDGLKITQSNIYTTRHRTMKNL